MTSRELHESADRSERFARDCIARSAELRRAGEANRIAWEEQEAKASKAMYTAAEYRFNADAAERREKRRRAA
jgi:hypothetical protein